MVNPSATPVGNAPIPAPLASPPKNVVIETIDQINQVYGWGTTFSAITSLRYEMLPIKARRAAMMAILSTTAIMWMLISYRIFSPSKKILFTVPPLPSL